MIEETQGAARLVMIEDSLEEAVERWLGAIAADTSILDRVFVRDRPREQMKAFFARHGAPEIRGSFPRMVPQPVYLTMALRADTDADIPLGGVAGISGGTSEEPLVVTAGALKQARVDLFVVADSKSTVRWISALVEYGLLAQRLALAAPDKGWLTFETNAGDIAPDEVLMPAIEFVRRITITGLHILAADEELGDLVHTGPIEAIAVDATPRDLEEE